MSEDLNFNQTCNFSRSKETQYNDPFMELFTPRTVPGKIVVDGEGIQIENGESGIFNSADIDRKIDNIKIKNLNDRKEPNIFEENFEKVKITMEAFMKGKDIKNPIPKSKSSKEKRTEKELSRKNRKSSPVKKYKMINRLPELKNLDFIADFQSKKAKTVERSAASPLFESILIETPEENEILSNSKIEQIILKENQESFDKLVDMFVEPMDIYKKSPKSHLSDDIKNPRIQESPLYANEQTVYKNQLLSQENSQRYSKEKMIQHHRSPIPTNMMYSPATISSLYTRQSSFQEYSLLSPFTINRPTEEFILKSHPPFKFHLKLFNRKRMLEEQRIKIERFLYIDGDIRFRFFRTVSTVADILNLPKPSPRASHFMRQLHVIFSKYSGLLSTPIAVLNTLKHLCPKYYIMYQTYVLPLERAGLYVPLKRSKMKMVLTSCSRDELISFMCTGIYDDIFFFFEQMEMLDVPSVLINELLSIFFLTSEVLFKKFDYIIPYLFAISRKIGDKPYRIVLEQMDRTTLHFFQLLVFKVILRFEQNKKNKLVLSDEITNCIIESLIKRKSLKKFLDIITEDNANGRYMNMNMLGYSNKLTVSSSLEDEIFIVKFIGLSDIKIQLNEKIIEILLNVSKIEPALVLRASRNFVNESNVISKLFESISGFIKCSFEQHLCTLRSKVLLKDYRQLEDIVLTFLPRMGLSIKVISDIISIIEQYTIHLKQKKVYFSKKGSSNIDLVLRFLRHYLSCRMASR